MALTRIERNQIFEAIAASNLAPIECSLQEDGDRVTITHTGSDSRFIFFPAASGIAAVYRVAYKVEDGANYTYDTGHRLDNVTPNITQWANEVELIASTPDLWAEARRSQELIIEIQQIDSDNNTPFTQDEQRQIAANLQEIKNQIRAQFELTNEQIEQIDARFDEAAQASTRMGRKDWLLLFGGTILNLIVTDTVTPGVAGRIFTMAINGLIHLFGGGPPQILA